MEVHHHSHGNAHKKVWKEYFWEFFMLFLAVFCGFLAELQLEHYIENQREKKYIRQFQQDLLADSTALTGFIISEEKSYSRIDSLLQIFVHKKYEENGNEAYYFARQLIRTSSVVLSDGTLNQLKFGGNLRLIDKDDVAKHIMEYDKAGREFELFQERNIVRTEEAAIQLEKLFDARTFYFMLNENNQIIRPTNNPQLISKSEADINTFVLRLQYVKGGTLRKINMAKRLKNRCTQLHQSLKEIYHLD
jgi:hypothetical protein